MESRCQSKAIVIFHRADYDGLFSGNIARKFYLENKTANLLTRVSVRKNI